MGKAKRKPRPSMPHWFWRDQDGCWFCKSPNNCNQCKANRNYAKKHIPKKKCLQFSIIDYSGEI